MLHGLSCLLVVALAPQEASLAAPTPKALVLRGGTVHSMMPGEAPRVADVWIVDGRIRALGGEAPSGFEPQVLDVAGKHLLPGLIDALVNFDPEHDALYLAHGVTLVRDMGGDHFALTQERAGARRERVPGPTLLTAGAALDGDPPASAAAVVLRSPEAAETYLPILFQESVDFLAVLPGLTEGVWKKVIELAHGKGLTVFGPRPRERTLGEALRFGQDGFQTLDSLLPPSVFWNAVSSAQLQESVAELARARAPLVPLLFASVLRLEDQSADPVRAALTGLLAPTYEAWWRSELAQRRPFLAPEHRALGELVARQQLESLRSAFAAGVRLVPGSGAPQPWLIPGLALHQELAQWVAAGVPSSEVLALATRGAAEALGLAGERGTLQPGAWADLIVLDADPREDLTRLLDPAWVVVRGTPVDRAGLHARLEDLARRQSERRAAAGRALEVEPPPQAEEGAVLLEGSLEHTSYGLLLALERYRVVRLNADTLLLSARIGYAAGAGGGARELTLEQFVRKGRLEQLHATLLEGEKRLEHDGLWTANSWRMQTRLDGRVIHTPPPLREQPACVEAGSASALLLVAQLAPSESVPLVHLHPGFDAEPVRWRIERDEEGAFRVRTHVGSKLFRLDEHGALTHLWSQIGGGVIEAHARSAEAFGGAGLPPPAPQATPGEPAPAGG
jgi:hypothetical protein